MKIDYASIEEMQVWARARMQRAPDFVIGDPDNPYLRRWWIVPRSLGCNVYLHEILRSDEDRAGHDHPWANTSYLIEGGYEEVIYHAERPWEEERRVQRTAGDITSRWPHDTHRLIVPEGGRAISLFMTGPKLKEWGFWCAGGKGWVHWQDFTAGEHGEIVGRGCGE
ncbi:hypothetical protein HY78_18900 [Rhizorhabdus wittichii DC-6]|nr:hypothetical protein HY78_18900 [Rhizorhabdus wittichii DC-6]